MSAAPNQEQDLFGSDPFAMDTPPGGGAAGADGNAAGGADGFGFPGADDADVGEEEETDAKGRKKKAKKVKAVKPAKVKTVKEKPAKVAKPKGPRYPATAYSWSLRTAMACVVVAIGLTLFILGMKYGFAMKP